MATSYAERKYVQSPLPVLSILLVASAGQARGNLQAVLDASLSGRTGAAAVMDIRTGSLIAVHGTDTAAGTLAHPGSVIKPFVLEALKAQGAAGVRIACAGRLQIGKRRLDCTHVPLNEPLDSHRAIAYSCNNWFAEASRHLSAEDLRRTLLRFGFASATGLARGEAVGSVDLAFDDNAKRLQALGETGVTVTPLELLVAYRKLALLVAADGSIAKDLSAAAEFGTAQLAEPLGSSVAAKTGTTSDGAWLAGWIPAAKPRYAIVVYLRAGSGGSDAAPVARQIFAALMDHDPHGVTVDHQALPFEEYVAGVLAGEAGTMRSAESLKAMAVTARTWAAAMRGRHRASGFDFCSTTHCQEFRPGSITPAVIAAVRATAGEMLWFNGNPAFTYYSRDCGGVTEAAEYVWPDVKAPYLREHNDPWCRNRGKNEWHAELNKTEILQALRREGLHAPARIGSVRVVSRTPSGRVDKIALGDVTVSGAAFRFAVGRQMGWNLVRSTAFEVMDSPSSIVLRGTGSGHGAGMCQTGAAHMGEQGRGYREILAFYYPGTTLSRSAQGLVWTTLSGERVQLMTTRAAADTPVLQRADSLASEVEKRTHLAFRKRPAIQVYPDVATFRNGAAEPGWVAASTQGHSIRMQPGVHDAVLRHELYHELMEQNAAPNLPVWFREGMVLYLENPGKPASFVSSANIDQAATRGQMADAYEAARSRVKRLVDARGEATALRWITVGLPAELSAPAPPRR